MENDGIEDVRHHSVATLTKWMRGRAQESKRDSRDRTIAYVIFLF